MDTKPSTLQSSESEARKLARMQHYSKFGMAIFATCVGGGVAMVIDRPQLWSILAWFAIFAIFHVACPLVIPLAVAVMFRREWGQILRQTYKRLDLTKQMYWRRLMRSQVYYIGATLMGIYLLCSKYKFFAYFTLQRTQKPVHGLLFGWDPLFDTAFAAAAGHWAITIFEDYQSQQFLAVNLDKAESLDGRKVFNFNVNRAMFYAYLVHHVMTFAAYTWSLQTHEFSALCCMGLAFEAPVVFLNIREFIIVFDSDTDAIRQLPRAVLPRTWSCVFFATFCCRYNSVLIYVWSIFFWRAEVGELPARSWIMYHTLGLFFSVLNLYWTGLLSLWVSQDSKKLGRAQQARIGAEVIPKKISYDLEAGDNTCATATQ